MTTNEEKVKQRERLLDRNKKILERAESEDRDVKTAEKDEWDANFTQIEALNAELDKGVFGVHHRCAASRMREHASRELNGLFVLEQAPHAIACRPASLRVTRNPQHLDASVFKADLRREPGECLQALFRKRVVGRSPRQ